MFFKLLILKDTHNMWGKLERYNYTTYLWSNCDFSFLNIKHIDCVLFQNEYKNYYFNTYIATYRP